MTPSLTQLLQDLEFQYDARSARTLWVPRVRSVRLEASRTHCTVVETSADASRPEKHRLELLWQDVLGAHILTEDGEHLALPIGLESVSKSKTYVFVLFAFPAKNHSPGSLKRRVLRQWLFRFQGDKMTDMVELLTWLNYLADPRSQEAIALAPSLEELKPVTHPTRKYLVIINPVGGAGKGVQMFEKHVAPIFKYTHVEAQVQLTERANHGTDIAEQLPLGQYDGVITVGGDGSLCEIFQGLMKRPDWKDAIKVPIGVIPGGSGNGLFASVMHGLGERFKPANAAFVIAKGLPQPLDLASVRNPHGDQMYSFLSTEWALIGDADIESEKLRMLGGLRFTVMIAHHVLLLRRMYGGRIWYLEDDPNNTSAVVPHNADEGSERPGFDLFENLEEGALASDGSGARWRKIEGPFQLSWAMNTSHAAPDCHTAPGAGLNDGYTYLVVLHQKHSRKDLIDLMLAIDKGTHTKVEAMDFIRTRAYRMEPENPDDVFCVDGELFKGPVESQVHHNVARIVSLPPTQSA
ncbi:hypothetical protein Poli38472_013112 [Pythium oligandrum]|uniref:DAGKc domain-containing protein n=1 Tax=Pythium oligandrum TaxID=41045 RepID=A0A8K1C2F3_PYTOL|nr:hypothetical protein Poli38472_013112 [Pythium oligandrum]|eukprot:TMW55221.1 hypothetical protein Poli38472_013112 [Pythium oligandrum]